MNRITKYKRFILQYLLTETRNLIPKLRSLNIQLFFYQILHDGRSYIPMNCQLMLEEESTRRSKTWIFNQKHLNNWCDWRLNFYNTFAFKWKQNSNHDMTNAMLHFCRLDLILFGCSKFHWYSKEIMWIPYSLKLV